ncbi:hypothetical protein [Paraburkholderia fungorum]|uniref:Uncharacterized protein n=1 Tax=Paraburkholderia fungorum TaxID=134537 RepID=A0A3R7E2W4_9BURK|nr:hypothetical protein [Paraburkholderia fungorum]RKF34460.1 hypothetical protein BCY88_38100 [Paraburkholderia fungorum]
MTDEMPYWQRNILEDEIASEKRINAAQRTQDLGELVGVGVAAMAAIKQRDEVIAQLQAELEQARTQHKNLLEEATQMLHNNSEKNSAWFDVCVAYCSKFGGNVMLVSDHFREALEQRKKGVRQRDMVFSDL